LNHQLLSLILDKAGLDQRVSIFIKNYLVGRKTKYIWNDFISPSFDINIGVEQGSALSFVLLALYLSLVFYSLEKILKIPISMISFVDNSLFVSQSKSISHSNTNIFCSYNVISSIFSKYDLIIEHGKTDVFHFTRSHETYNPPLLNLTPIDSPLLLPKEI